MESMKVTNVVPFGTLTPAQDKQTDKKEKNEVEQ
jgi:hypothetical protein